MKLCIDRIAHSLPRLGSFALGLGLLLAGSDARAAETDAKSEGAKAIETYRESADKKKKEPVTNRFFVKERRLEIAPTVGLVTNNPFAQRYTGSLQIGYHVTDTFSLQFHGLFSPDAGEGDLKNLVGVLLERANTQQQQQGTGEFQQPLDKLSLAGTVAVAWAPIYGKINLIGETVLNFDLYLTVGAGAIVKNNYVATFGELGLGRLEDIVDLGAASPGSEVLPSGTIGIGQNYFVNQTIAVKIDARAMFWVDNPPQYDPLVPVTGSRLYNNFLASAGIAIFFPKMKPRLYNY